MTVDVAIKGRMEVQGQPVVLPSVELMFRSLQPGDYPAFKALHQELFPIDYDEQFFQKATTSADRLFSFAAVPLSSNGGPPQEPIGFITARLMHAHECDPVDRHHLGLSSPVHANTPIVYILTLGVTRTWQNKGVARMLLQHVHHRAQAMRWHAIFLHVITYNQAAIKLYNSQSYRCVAFLKNFYLINSGRQINPDQIHYDAYLYALTLDDLAGPMQGMLGWQGAVAFNMALAPIRNALGHFNTCMPWLCSDTQPQHQQQLQQQQQQRTVVQMPSNSGPIQTSDLTPQPSTTLLAPSPTSPPHISSTPLPDPAKHVAPGHPWGQSQAHSPLLQHYTQQLQLQQQQLHHLQQLNQQQGQGPPPPVHTQPRRTFNDHHDSSTQYRQTTEGSCVASRVSQGGGGGGIGVAAAGSSNDNNGLMSWGVQQPMPGGGLRPTHPSLFQWLSGPTR